LARTSSLPPFTGQQYPHEELLLSGFGQADTGQPAWSHPNPNAGEARLLAGEAHLRGLARGLLRLAGDSGLRQVLAVDTKVVVHSVPVLKGAHFGQVVYGGCAILGRRTSYELFDSLDLLSQFLMVMSWVCSRASSDLYIYLWATVHSSFCSATVRRPPVCRWWGGWGEGAPPPSVRRLISRLSSFWGLLGHTDTAI
jgi:hypothetical protein